MMNELIDKLTITVAQLNPTVGDIAGNLEKARNAHSEAALHNADILLLSEMFISGYPPEDLVLKRVFQDTCCTAIQSLADETADGGPAILIGTPWREDDKLYNSYCLLDGGEIKAVRHKIILPDYGIFDETRLFEPGDLSEPVLFRGISLGLLICEDIWTANVAQHLLEQGAEILIVPKGSPFCIGKWQSRRKMAQSRTKESGLPLIYVNQVGGQDEIVFDGSSFALNANQSVAFQMPAFMDSVNITTWHRDVNGWMCQDGTKTEWLEKEEAIYVACVLALRDYVKKTGFSNILIGLSGGIDSALCAAIATDAIGADCVHCVMMPYDFTSSSSLTDAAACAVALGVRYDLVPIHGIIAAFETILHPLFGENVHDITRENIQSRVRGVTLMSISNELGAMLVTTGNKSELSVGYATLYGDMSGGYNPIKDIYKTEVFALAQWRNSRRPLGTLGPDGLVIPESIISKAPSAELREGQKDDDFLPPYDVLDVILYGLIEQEASVADLITSGHDAKTVAWVEQALHSAEYKRRQAAPGVKISCRHFGRDRRYPIVNQFCDRNF